MIKRIQFLFLILSAFAFFSCSNQVEKSASVTFSLSKNAVQKITSARAATDDSASGTETGESDGWSLIISLSGGYTTEQIYQIQEISENSSQESQFFILNNLPADEKVNVDVNVYCGEVQYFKAKETKTLTLAEGANSVDVVLTKAFTDSDSSDDNSGTSTDDDSKTSTTGDSEISIVDSSSISISATGSDGTTYTYSSSSIPAIPYLTETTFTLSSSDFDSYTWYLNKEKLDGTGSSISLIPAKYEVILTGTNSLVCFYGTNFLAEFKFTVSGAASTDTTSDTTSSTSSDSETSSE